MGNLIVLDGNIGKDAETRYTPAGGCVVTFSVATTKSWKDKVTNKWVDHTDWHNCVCFDKTAERAAKQVKKGKPIFCQGEIVYKHVEKGGVKQTYTTIKVTSFRVTEHPAKGNQMVSGVEARLPPEDHAMATDDQFDDDAPF